MTEVEFEPHFLARRGELRSSRNDKKINTSIGTDGHCRFVRRSDIHRFPDVREESRNVRYGAGAPLHGFGLPVPRPRQLAGMSVKEWFRWLVGSSLNR